jgi:transcriptional regulator with XRE-family HTH domain
MNRLREIREARGLTQEQVADKLGTTATHISRLENERSQLTHHWMVKFAELYRVRPADLIANVVVAEVEQEVEPMPLTDPVAAAIAMRGMRVYRVIGSSVEDAGIRRGDTITVDESEGAIAGIAGLDVVLVEIGKDRARVLRQWVPPGMLVTNRVSAGANLAITMGDLTVSPEIIGVVIRPRAGDGSAA